MHTLLHTTSDKYKYELYYIYYIVLQLDTEWKNNNKVGGLQGLDGRAKEEIDWVRLEQLSENGEFTLFTSRLGANPPQ